jgi:hypothetical protein
MLKAAFAIVTFLALAGCDANDRVVMVLKCDQTALDKDFRCPVIARKGSDLSLLVNPATQKVQITTVESNGDFFPGSWIYDCSVVDMNNWKCIDNSVSGTGQFKMTMSHTYAMNRGPSIHASRGWFSRTQPIPRQYGQSRFTGAALGLEALEVGPEGVINSLFSGKIIRGDGSRPRLFLVSVGLRGRRFILIYKSHD